MTTSNDGKLVGEIVIKLSKQFTRDMEQQNVPPHVAAAAASMFAAQIAAVVARSYTDRDRNETIDHYAKTFRDYARKVARSMDEILNKK